MNEIDELKTGNLYPFSNWPHSTVPLAAVGVYSIWNNDGLLVYVGMSGRGIFNLRARLLNRHGQSRRRLRRHGCTRLRSRWGSDSVQRLLQP